jgi:hypothetical protein
VIVLFPPGWGGNHFSNMLSMSPKIENRQPSVTDQEYINNLKLFYNDINQSTGHIQMPFTNVGIHDLDNSSRICLSSERPYIIAGHIDEAYYSFERLKSLKNFVFIVFSLLDVNDIEKRSWKDINNISVFLYKENIVKKIFDDETVKIDTLNLEPKELFVEDAADLYKKFNDTLNLDLDIELCQQLHKKWYNKL